MRGVRPALGLGALAGVVDQERVDQRQVAQRGVGAAARRTCRAFLPGSHSRVPCLPRCTTACGAEARAPATGRRPGSGGWAAGPGRGRSRPGSPRTRAAAGPAGRRCRRAARPARSRRRGRVRSTYSSPGGGPQALGHRCRAGRRAARRTTRGTAAAGMRTGRLGQLLVGQPVRVLAAAPRSGRGSARRRRRLDAGQRAGAGQRPDVVARARACARSSATALAGVSRPTALPIRACLVG